MKNIFILTILIFLTLTFNVYWEYKEVDCSTSPTFWENNCKACFDWWEINLNSNLSFLDDIWFNPSNNRRILFKEEQVMPEMKALNWTNFVKNPDNDTFWEYTKELEALYSNEFEWYVLPAWQKVTWIKSSLWSSYNFKSLPEKWLEAWILIFDIKTHNVSDDWEVDLDDQNSAHRECVIYTSWFEKKEFDEEVQKEEKDDKDFYVPEVKDATKVEAWSPLFLISLIISMLAWLAIFRRRK